MRISKQKALLTYYHDSIPHEKLPDFKWHCIAFIGDETRKLQSFECKLCSAKFQTLHNLKRHIDTIHDFMKMFTCECCNYSSCKEDLENHICKSVHEKNNQLECEESFSEIGKEKEHIEFVHESKNTMDEQVDKENLISSKKEVEEDLKNHVVKFIYSEKASKFCKTFALLLSYVAPVKSKMEISQNFMAFLEYMNFTFL